MTLEQYKELKAKAATEGFYVGLLWLFSFAAYVCQFMIPSASFAMMIASAASVIMTISRLRLYRNRYLDELPYFKAFVYSLMVYFYASLIMACGQWVYFQFIDQGFLLSEYVKMIDKPEFKVLLNEVPELKPDDVKMMFEQVASLRPIDLAMQFLSTNILISVFLAFFTAMLSFGKATTPIAANKNEK